MWAPSQGKDCQKLEKTFQKVTERETFKKNATNPDSFEPKTFSTSFPSDLDNSSPPKKCTTSWKLKGCLHIMNMIKLFIFVLTYFTQVRYVILILI